MEFVKLGTILKMNKGKKPVAQSKIPKEGYLPYCDIKAFENGKIDSYTDGVKCVECDDGDVLIVCDGSRSGLVGYAIKGYVGSTLAKISAEGVDNKFLFYFLKSKYTLLNTNVKGTGTPHVNQIILKESIINVPSLDKQQRIVERVEELFSELDKAEKTLLKIKSQLEVYKQAVLKEAFHNCPMVSLGNISDSRLGKMLDKKKNTGKPCYYLRNINVRWFDFQLDDLLKMPFEDKEIEKFTVKKGDLLICEGGEPGRCAVWKYDNSICFQKAIHRVRFNPQFVPDFYAFYILYLSKTGDLNSYFTGSGIKHLTGESLVKIPVPQLSYSEQLKIVEVLESKFSIIKNISNNFSKTLTHIKAMRQAILKEAFEGKLV